MALFLQQTEQKVSRVTTRDTKEERCAKLNFLFVLEPNKPHKLSMDKNKVNNGTVRSLCYSVGLAGPISI